MVNFNKQIVLSILFSKSVIVNQIASILKKRQTKKSKNSVSKTKLLLFSEKTKLFF